MKEESKMDGKQSIKQAAKLPKTVIKQVDDTTEKVVDTSVSVANQPNPDISKGVDLLAVAAALISEKSSAQKDTPVDDASVKTVVDTVMGTQDLISQKNALAVLAKDMSVDELEDTARLVSMFSTENVEVQLAAIAREHAELIQQAQKGPEATDIQKTSAEVQPVRAEEIQGTENALADTQQVVHFLDSISDALLFLSFANSFCFQTSKDKDSKAPDAEEENRPTSADKQVVNLTQHDFKLNCLNHVSNLSKFQGDGPDVAETTPPTATTAPNVQEMNEPAADALVIHSLLKTSKVADTYVAETNISLLQVQNRRDISPSASTLALTDEAILSEFREKIVTRAEKALKKWQSYKKMDFLDLYNLMQIESRRKQLFDLDHFVHTMTSYEEYSFAERMEQKFIDLELKALTERFQNLSRE